MNKKDWKSLWNETSIIIDILSRMCLGFAVYFTFVNILVLVLPNPTTSKFSQYGLGVIFMLASMRLATLGFRTNH